VSGQRQAPATSPGEISVGNGAHRLAGWATPRAGYDLVAKGNILAPAWNRTPLMKTTKPLRQDRLPSVRVLNTGLLE
jgi:hypothetical protein